MVKKALLVVLGLLGALAVYSQLGVIGLAATGLVAMVLIYRQRKESAARDAVAEVLYSGDDSDA